MTRRDIVVVGTSLGGFEALRTLVSGLPADFPASLFIVQHTEPYYSSKLPELLAAAGPLPAHHAIHGERLEPGVVVVAPPDNHIMLREGYVQVVRGPKESGHRPAVDALFRTAATAYGPRVVGVVLTGTKDCGTAGLMSVKARGGVTVVQDPNEALAREMPESAIAHTDVDHIVKLHEIAPLLRQLTSEPSTPSPPLVSHSVLAIEGSEGSPAAVLVCPSCQGRLEEASLNGYEHYRCHEGHTFSSATIVEEQAHEVERALWAASRALTESAALAERAALRSPPDIRRRLEEQGASRRRDADIIRKMLLGSPVGG